MVRVVGLSIVMLILTGFCAVSFGIERFPPPDFVETRHQIPSTDQIIKATPRQELYEYIDITMLAATLLLSSYLILKKRSRRAIFILMVFSLLYFGFWRRGCVCSVGAMQNLVLSIFDKTSAVSLTVLAFFILPLVSTLFFGRTFCAAVCPLGAMQDMVLMRPVAVPQWIERGLRLFAYLYLAASVLFAATGSAFIICRYDPFISFYRLSGNLNLLILGVCFLVIAVFIGRPYCRFLCPYGVILRQLSKVSRWKVTITPDDCIKCRLCENACPFGAIEKPTAEWPQIGYTRSKVTLGLLILLLPLLVLAGGWSGTKLSTSWSRMHATIRLAERIYLENEGLVQKTTRSSNAFRATGKPVKQLYDKATQIRARFKYGGSAVGAFMGLVAGISLIKSSIRVKRTDYVADRAGCLACGQCFEYCPREQVRLKKLRESRTG